MLVTPSRTNFFVSKDKGRGFELEMFNLLELEVNKKRKQQKLTPLQIQFVSVPHNELLSISPLILVNIIFRLLWKYGLQVCSFDLFIHHE